MLSTFLLECWKLQCGIIGYKVFTYLLVGRIDCRSVWMYLHSQYQRGIPVTRSQVISLSQLQSIRKISLARHLLISFPTIMIIIYMYTFYAMSMNQTTPLLLDQERWLAAVTGKSNHGKCFTLEHDCIVYRAKQLVKLRQDFRHHYCETYVAFLDDFDKVFGHNIKPCPWMIIQNSALLYNPHRCIDADSTHSHLFCNYIRRIYSIVFIILLESTSEQSVTVTVFSKTIW